MPVHDLVFTYDFPPVGGGISRWIEEMARRYPPGTLRVSTGSMPGQEAIDCAFPNPVDRIAVSSHRLKTLRGRLAWRRRAGMLASDPMARFSWCGSLRPAGYPARHAWKRYGVPYGVLVHGGDLLRFVRRIRHSALKRATYRALFQPARVIAANSRWTADCCRALLHDLQLDAVADRITVVPLGTDPLRFRADPGGAAAFRARCGLPEATWLVTVARLVPHKGIDTAIRVVAELALRHPRLRYAVVGRGPLRQELQELSARLGVGDRVHFLDSVGDDELAAAYSIGSVYLGLSRENERDVEGFGISLSEAAACGLPVVAARAGGIPDTVDDGITGLLSPPEDVSAAARAVETLLADPALAAGLGAAGRVQVERFFNWDRVVRHMRELAETHGRKEQSARG